MCRLHWWPLSLNTKQAQYKSVHIKFTIVYVDRFGKSLKLYIPSLVASLIHTYVRRENIDLFEIVVKFVFVSLESVYYISYVSLQSFMSIE